MSGAFDESGVAVCVYQSENTVALFAELYVARNFFMATRVVFLENTGGMEDFALLTKVAEGFFV
ncbi:MAG: hypothetical protein VYD52_10365 [Pseudomonadota bacterium]|nr:hypothetical protein [Pseudomonadota bacterium]MEC9410840.1 hypothetical protein [Pseudomonadota bacterium]